MRDRRSFIRKSGLALLPGLLPMAGFTSIIRDPDISVPLAGTGKNADLPPVTVNFVSDGEILSPSQQIAKLSEIDKKSAISADSYNEGGVVAALEKEFEKITGKPKAIYLPTGTMANQLAIAALSANGSKIFVQETSHVFRDEADAAQTVHGKRLIPLAKGKTGFTAEELAEAVEYYYNGEVFKTGDVTVSIENPVRRTDGGQIPFEELKKISAYCRSKNIKLHLDGARLFLASGYSGVSIKEYATLFDTVYISLYKYFGAAGGAILCGDNDLIAKMPHLVKVFGGTMYQSWPQAAMALNTLNGFEARFKASIQKADKLFTELNKLPQIKINPHPNGSNLFTGTVTEKVSTRKLSETLRKYGVLFSGFMREGKLRIAVNESILKISNEDLLKAFAEGLS
ncbi:MAG: aminotransferase class I/II-fold pyridoxal phosphate-dependent enzyme [Flavitalea sp.]